MKNILLIVCDQLSALALECYGNSYGEAMHIQALAQESVVVENAYCTYALCQPSRASFWTSRYPHETQIDSNMRSFSFPHLTDSIETLGEVFQQAGYACMHFGKEHDYGSLRGFQRVASEEIEIPRDDPAINLAYETFLDIDTTQKTVAWLESDEARKKPFLVVSDLQNPHNICFYIGENQEGTQDFMGSPELPPLPDNFSTEDLVNRPRFIQYLCCAHRRLRHASHWSPEDYQHYLYAYYDYIQRVDKQIGEILSALNNASLDEDTLVVFMADHGEGMAAHGLVTKYGNFYEESMRVPLIFRLGKDKRGRRLKGIASLLDLKPTLMDYAGIETSNEDRGTSLWAALVDENENISPTPYVVSQWQDEFKDYTVPGRMYRFGSYKYCVYRDYAPMPSNAIIMEEEFYDLGRDPGEMKNLIQDPNYQEQIREARLGLDQYIKETGDPFYTLVPDYDRLLYRQHALGYHNHEGLSAVEHYTKKRDALN